MKGDFSLEFRGDYIHIQHDKDFEISPESMNEFWTALGEACEQYKCPRVLAEGPAPKRRMDTIGAFESGIHASKVAVRLSLALCFYDYKTDELSDFFKTVARNRGARVEFFTDRDEALRWLGVERKEN